MATTLKQFWTGEVARLDTRLAALGVELSALRGTLTAALATQSAASGAVTAQAKAVDDARKALAGIATPADGDPLLAAMEQALIALADARTALATADRDVQAATAELNRLQGWQTAQQAARADADKAAKQAEADAKLRQTWIDALTVGDLKTLAADAAAALAGAEATARARVEGEFPSSGTPAKDFLTVARARRGLPLSSLDQAVAVEAAAFATDTSALDRALRTFAAAADAVRRAFQAAPRLAADTAVLQRLAALPAAHPAVPTSYPIVTVWQHNRLHDATLQNDRENALSKLKDVDDAAAALRTAQSTYDSALHAALVADPDKTPAELDASVVKPQKDDVAAKLATLATQRAALSAAEIQLVKAWFAAVPDTLWDALDKLDTAAGRLQALSSPPAPPALIATLAAAEDALATALAADRLAQRQHDAADLALQRATGLLASERETAGARATACTRGATLF